MRQAEKVRLDALAEQAQPTTAFFFWLHLHSSRSPGHHDRRGWKKRSASVAKRMRSWPGAAPRPSLGSEP